MNCPDCQGALVECSCWSKAKARIAKRRAALASDRDQHLIWFDDYKADGRWSMMAIGASIIARIDAELAGLAIAMGDA